MELKIGRGKSTGLQVDNCELTLDENCQVWSFVFITVNISKYRLPPRNFVVKPLPYTCIHSHRQMHTSFDLCWMKAYMPVSLSMMVFHTVCYRLVGLQQVYFAALNPAFSIPFSPLGSTLSRLLNI